MSGIFINKNHSSISLLEEAQSYNLEVSNILNMREAIGQYKNHSLIDPDIPVTDWGVFELSLRTLWGFRLGMKLNNCLMFTGQ